MQEFNLTEAQQKLAQLVEDALNGEEILITKGTHKVRLTAVRNGGSPKFGSAKGLLRIGADFDDPLPDFESYS